MDQAVMDRRSFVKTIAGVCIGTAVPSAELRSVTFRHEESGAWVCISEDSNNVFTQQVGINSKILRTESWDEKSLKKSGYSNINLDLIDFYRKRDSIGYWFLNENGDFEDTGGLKYVVHRLKRVDS